MYCHAREIQHVKYGKVGPPPLEAIDPDFKLAYQWLGQYCGFYPQVWLSRSQSGITGFRRTNFKKRAFPDEVLFAFETIQGFPVDYMFWCKLLCTLTNCKDINHANEKIPKNLDWNYSDPESHEEPVSQTWLKTRNLAEVLSKHLFVKNDQVIVPQLNLKAAKIIICRSEGQKKTLRQMGFIEDRLIIRGRRNQTGWRRGLQH